MIFTIFIVKIIEYNPKLSEVSSTTRVAYVKFMAPSMRRESSADENKSDTDTVKSRVQKSILRTASKLDTVHLHLINKQLLLIKNIDFFAFLSFLLPTK